MRSCFWSPVTGSLPGRSESRSPWQDRVDATPGAVGDLVLHVDDAEVGRGTIRTQPARFGLGSGLTVGRTLAPSADPDVAAPGAFTGGEIEAVVDVAGEPFVDHEAEVAAWLAHD